MTRRANSAVPSPQFAEPHLVSRDRKRVNLGLAPENEIQIRLSNVP